MGAGRSLALLATLIALVLGGCRSEMYDQPRYKPYHASGFFEDGTSARPLVAGTVSRRDPNERGKASAEHFDTGKTGGKLADVLPFPVDRSVLERGQDRYRIFCTPCHGELGNGRGMIVRRGFNPPPSFHSDELRKAAGRPLLRRDDSRIWHDVFVCVTNSPAGPLGNRGLHPGTCS